MDHAAIINTYDDAAVGRLREAVERLMGGRIVAMERLVRWRPAWSVRLERDGAELRVHLRGDRGGDVAIFPDLKREADIVATLRSHAIPVPQVHGFIADPPCIVMEEVAGTRDFSALDAQTKSAVGRTYMQSLAAMHALPLEPFADIGISAPSGAEAIALVGLDAYMPQYRRTKSRPEPLLEFVIGWLRRNVPKDRTEARFIQFDAGQYLVDEGRLTALFDFEFAMIGDPLFDLATMGMRDSYEPIGAPLAELVRYYEEATGARVDHHAILFHVLQFSTLGTMQFTGTVGDPKPGDPHSVYLMFDLSLRRSILLALSRLANIPLPDLPALDEACATHTALLAKLRETVEGIETADEAAGAARAAATELIEWAIRADRFGASAASCNIADIAALLAREFASETAAMQALEERVLAAGPDEDPELIALLMRIEGRHFQLFGPTALGAAARGVVLPRMN